MRRLALALASSSLAVAVIAITPAAADPTGPALDFTLGSAMYRGAIADSAGSHYSPEIRFGVGLQRGRWAVLATFEGPLPLDVTEPADAVTTQPYVESMIGLGGGPLVRYDLNDGGGFHLALHAAYLWRWFFGSSTTRACDLHGGCDGGYFMESPIYPAHGPMIALVISSRWTSDLKPGVGLVIAATRMTVDRPGFDPDLRGSMVSLGLNVALGR